MTTKTTKLSVFAFLGLGLVAYGQYNGKVGINTPYPNATLEIQISDANKSGNTKEGILIPNVSADRAENMGTGLEDGTLLFIGSGAANATGTTSNYNGKGFYYFDKTAIKWVKVGAASTTKEFTARLGQTVSPSYEWTKEGGISSGKEIGLADFYEFTTNAGALKLPAPSAHKGAIIHFKNSTGGTQGLMGWISHQKPHLLLQVQLKWFGLMELNGIL
ncbi:hypothetical protein RIU45_06440 [Riemerella anatipestifer]|uniref:hypothetical protein n=1 Tax=Riemerella anatipestifer TaxID=34085 RepID=UPI0028599EC3|nr:hypothetical protein [Riemerella anatipestifer]MDR7794609.1 hypothetical protein [Riemerella anatipestifer]